MAVAPELTVVERLDTTQDLPAVRAQGFALKDVQNGPRTMGILREQRTPR